MSTTPPPAPSPKSPDATGESNTYERINDFGAVRISLASPQDIRSWSHGEVKKPETINYRTYRPEKDGLFCERIFGPEKDWECTCGKYRGMKYKGMVCDRCGVKVTHSRVRRKRMGHIELAAPVVHIWFFKAMPSRLGTLLDMKTTSLEKIIYFQDYVVIDPGTTDLKERQLLTEDEYKFKRQEYGDSFEVDMGAEAIKKLLERLDLVKLSAELRERLDKEMARGEKASKQRTKELVKRLKTVEALRDSSNRCEYMVLECIPVIPPDLRPLVLLDSGNFATSDLNDLYRRIINRNNRLKKLVDLNAPEVIIRNEKRMLQQSVDALFDNNRCKRPVLGSSNRPLKSLTDMIKGKQGRFRENLLGKRVDYSARSVIVVGPELKLHQCGLPKKIALELFQPFIIRRLKELQHADTIKSAKKMLERKDDVVWDILEEVTKNHPVLLNRAPTLHRMGIQAFEPVLIEGNAIRIHPLVCKGFNADFDGDQMAVHLPLSIEAQVEATVLMMSTNNIFSPANGNPIITPSQDIVMGCYYLTAARGTEDEAVEAGDGMIFHSPEELFRAFAEHKLGLHAKIRVRLPQGYVEVTEPGDTKFDEGSLVTSEAFFAEEARIKEHNSKHRGPNRLRPPEGIKFQKKVISDVKDEKGAARAEELPRKPNGLVRTTVGRVIFNDILHPKMAFYDLALGSKYLSRIIADCYQLLGRRETIALLDRMKETGFRESTRSGLSFAASDLRTPENKEGVLKEKDKEVEKVRRQFEKGIITNEERYNKVLDHWMDARDQITKKMMTDLQNDRRTDQVTGKMVPYLNPIFLMAHSGARGGIEQIRQLAGMRGLMAKPSGQIIETPIKSNFREGLTVLEYFSSTHGARKGLADTALKTADSGYLTRKLADVAQNVVITTHDCGTTRGIEKKVMYKGEEVDRSLADAIRGRVSRETIKNPTTKEAVLHENEMITPAKAKDVEKLGLDKITVRSPMTCEAPLGVCRLCYGMDLATGNLVEDGMAVGIIAAQSIGEPGTQLTMRTFHIGGVAQGKGQAVDSEHKTKKGGIVQFEGVKIVTNDEGRHIALAPRTGEITILRGKDGPIAERFGVPNGAEVFVLDGQEVQQGTALVKWDPHSVPIIAEEGGTVKYADIKEGLTLRKEKDAATGIERRTIMEHKGDLHPAILILGERGQSKAYYIPERANLQVTEGQKIHAGTLLAKTPREVSQTQDITGGLPRVTELFEARRPRGPAVMAEIAGKVRVGEKKRGKKIVIVEQVTEDGKPTGEHKEHMVPAGAILRVHENEYVKEGDPLVYGPLVPHDILRIQEASAVQDYMVREVQAVYRSQRVDIDDKHIEIIVAQMLRKVKVKSTGDTGLLPGAVMDRFAFQEVNRRLTEECVKIVDPGDSSFEAGKVVRRDAYEEERANLEKAGGRKKLPTCETPLGAENEVQLLGITKAAVQSDSFISAASFQETTKVLTEAALASKVDYLVGLKENVILGHLIPAGTGFKTHQEAEVKYVAGAGEETPAAEGEGEVTPDATVTG
jgi:DNA-directed RNA polymerase subunit beta'